jgi:hypothetical protein
MRYNAFFGELPLNAFKPRPSGGMTFEGGNPISAVTDAIGDVVEGVGDVGQTVINEVGNAGKAIDQTVRDVLPGGWTTAALLAAGYYYSPEIGAYMNAQGATVPLSQVADASVAAAPTAAAGSAGTGLTAGGTGLGLTLPEATTGLGMTAPAGSGLAAGTTAGTSAANLAGLGAGLGTSGLASGTGSLLGAAGAGAAGSALGSAAAGAAGAGAGSSLSSMLPYMTAGQIGTGLLQANAATNAADIQAAAADRATAIQQRNFDIINAQQAPYRGAGYGALNKLAGMGSGQTQMYDETGKPIGAVTGATDYLTRQFSPEDFAAGIDPGYAFRLQQGQMANQRAANVGGGALSGNTLRGLQDYTQGLASQEYGNAFNRFQTQRQNIYNTLAGIAGIGQAGQTATNTAGTNLANAASQLGVGAAGAQAAGLTGQTNALANTAQNVIGNYTLASLLNQRGNVALPTG